MTLSISMTLALVCFIISIFILGMVLGDYLREREERERREKYA
jgi:hypothetical protein